VKIILSFIALVVFALSFSSSPAMALDAKSPKVKEDVASAKQLIESQSIVAKYMEKTLGSEMAFETKLEDTSLGKEDLEVIYYLTVKYIHKVYKQDEFGGVKIMAAYERLQEGNFNGANVYDTLYRDFQNPKILAKYIEKNVLPAYK